MFTRDRQVLTLMALRNTLLALLKLASVLSREYEDGKKRLAELDAWLAEV